MGMDATRTKDQPVGGAPAMGAMIRVLRRRTGMSQSALGARCAMHPHYLGAIERGDVANPGVATVSRIADGLHASIGVLAGSYASTGVTQLPVGIAADREWASGDTAYVGAREMGRAIRLLRRRLELTQGEIADLVGLHRGYISSLEAGDKRNPGLRTITRVAQGLIAQPDELSTRVAELAKVFTGELTVDELRRRDLPTTSGSTNPLRSPGRGEDP